MRRKLNLAIAVVCRPPVLLLDEPSCGLDPLARLAIAKVIKRLSSPTASPSSPWWVVSSDPASPVSRNTRMRERDGHEPGDEYEGKGLGHARMRPCKALHVDRKARATSESERAKEEDSRSIALQAEQQRCPGDSGFEAQAMAGGAGASGRDDSACCVIISSHAMEEVEALASRVLVLESGRLLCVGTPQQITVNSQVHREKEGSPDKSCALFRVKVACAEETLRSITLAYFSSASPLLFCFTPEGDPSPFPRVPSGCL